MAKAKVELDTGIQAVLLAALGLPDPANIITVEQATSAVKRFKEVEALVEAYAPGFKEKVFAVADAYGVKDEKGNATVKLADGSGYKKEVRQSITIDQEKTVQIFKEKGHADKIGTVYTLKGGLKLADLVAKIPALLSEPIRAQFFDAHEGVSEDEIEKAFFDGIITDAELKATTTKKIVNALKEIKPKV